MAMDLVPDTAATEPQPPSSTTTAAAIAAVETKQILGKYQLGRLLGRGSFAKVYHARSITDNQSVAIKVIDKTKTTPSMEPLIVREVEAMRRLKHPNVLRIHEVMATKSKIYLVMELARGGDLFAKLTRRPNHRFPEPLARHYFHQLVSALHYCHQNGVAHRDVKPQNLLLDEDGNVKVTDFGLSAVADTPDSRDNLLLQTACGTPAFAAPEIVGRSRAGYDGSKADAWSCGVILFVLLAGYLPFDDTNLVLMYRKMHRREFRFPPWISKHARALITRLLDPNPKSRLSIEALKKDPWLNSHGSLYSRSVSLGDFASLEEKKYHERSTTNTTTTGSSSMNAFEIISMSSGLDLSGLFNDKGMSKMEKRFTSRELKGTVVEKVVEVGTKLGYEVERREKGSGGGCVWLGKGRLVLSVVVSEVASEMVLVALTVVDGGGLGRDQEELHWKELSSGLGDIVASWHH